MENIETVMFTQTVIYDKNDDIFIQFLCDFFGINYQSQLRFIKNDHILKEEWTKKSTPDLFPDGQKRHCLTKSGFLRWITILNPNIIKEELRENFKIYQKSVVDYLYGKSLVPNIKRQHEIDIRMRELNCMINTNMLEHKSLEIEKRQLMVINYNQLGLSFPEYEPEKAIGTQTFFTKKQLIA